MRYALRCNAGRLIAGVLGSGCRDRMQETVWEMHSEFLDGRGATQETWFRICVRALRDGLVRCRVVRRGAEKRMEAETRRCRLRRKKSP